MFLRRPVSFGRSSSSRAAKSFRWEPTLVFLLSRTVSCFFLSKERDQDFVSDKTKKNWGLTHAILFSVISGWFREETSNVDQVWDSLLHNIWNPGPIPQDPGTLGIRCLAMGPIHYAKRRLPDENARQHQGLQDGTHLKPQTEIDGDYYFFLLSTEEERKMGEGWKWRDHVTTWLRQRPEARAITERFHSTIKNIQNMHYIRDSTEE